MSTLDVLSAFLILSEIEGSGEKKTVVVVILGEQMSTVVINVPGLLFIISLETPELSKDMDPLTE